MMRRLTIVSEGLKPGLYKATVRGVADVVVLVDSNNMGHLDWLTDSDGVTSSHVSSEALTDARPLIVLDLAPVISRPRLAALLRDLGYGGVAEQIEAQTKPARIPEPGWDGKVLAHTAKNSIRREFVRFSRIDGLYTWADGNAHQGSLLWDDLVDPILIREGVN
jgi:hypothetical protein